MSYQANPLSRRIVHSRDAHEPNPSPAAPTSDSSLRISPLSSVHRVFLIQETAGLIMDELPPKSLLHTGLLCRALYKPAMDRLWHTTSSLARLLRCLPEELVEMVQCSEYGGRVLRIKQVPELYQWWRVLHHARRIKIIISSQRDVCRETLHLLARHYPGGCMFPNLQETRLSGPSCSREVLLLVQLSSLTVHYEINPTLPRTWHLYRVAQHSPELEVFRITDSTRPDDSSCFTDPEICHAISNSLLQLGNLTVVDFMAVLEPPTIDHLAALPRLTHLALQLRDNNCIPPNAAPHRSCPFISLTSLRLRGRDPTQLASWLSTLLLPSLATLYISTEKPSLAGTSSVEELFGVVSRFQGLTRLDFRFAVTSGCFADENILDLLLKRLPFVEEFSLFGLAFNPTKVSLSAMISSWRRLRILELHQTCYVRPSTHRIPLRDLILFAQHCPTIERIAISLSPYMLVNPTRFDAQGDFAIVTEAIPPLTPSSIWQCLPVAPDPAILPVSRLQVLQVTDYFEPEDYQHIAEFLANVFPAALLTFRCPRSRRPVMEKCIESILSLKEEYLRARQSQGV